MLKDLEAVSQALRTAVLAGKDPRYDEESCEDYFIDWKVLSSSTFQRIKETALQERASLSCCGAGRN